MTGFFYMFGKLIVSDIQVELFSLPKLDASDVSLNSALALMRFFLK